MRELELRLALVCYGGASLAVYMNGITSEILNAIRGSRNHCQPEIYPRFSEDIETTSDVYHAILEDLGRSVKIRIIVDVISGASAGGINGIMLARALAHDLDFSPLKKMWMELGDVEELMDKETISDKWSKLYMVPIMHLFGKQLTGKAFDDPEIRRKVMRFVRSRWFEAPFSGDIMLTWMLEAARDLGSTSGSNSCLLPAGHQLDLFVPITNFYGQKKILPIHDPSFIYEPRHQTTLKFTHKKGFNSHNDQQALADHNIPALGFAARATSSFPGAFPSVSFKDLDDKLQSMGLDWGFRKKFIARNFPEYYNNYDGLSSMSFIDGGVTNNKPFDAAISAIQGKPAHRQVDRRVVFVDPVPDTEVSEVEMQQGPPGFFKTILASLAAIPRVEPIYNDLMDIEAHNVRARKAKSLTQTISRSAGDYADQFVSEKQMKKLDLAMLASWREQSHESAHKMAGISYDPYITSKAMHIMDLLKRLFIMTYGIGEKEMYKRIRAWGLHEGLIVDDKREAQLTPKQKTAHKKQALMKHIDLFRGLDITYRIRRLRYVISQINDLLLDDIYIAETHTLEELKQICYDMVEEFTKFWGYKAFRGIKFDSDLPIGDAVKQIKDHVDFEGKDLTLDEQLVDKVLEIENIPLRHAIIRAYIGFTFYDVLSLPYQSSFEHTSKSEVKVDRISPQDCYSILGHEFSSPLMGTELYNFGAFFSRRARENDYLWGRIHAANRTLDFLINAADKYGLPDGFNSEAYRRRLMKAILREETAEMPNIQDILSSLRQKW